MSSSFAQSSISQKRLRVRALQRIRDEIKQLKKESENGYHVLRRCHSALKAELEHGNDEDPWVVSAHDSAQKIEKRMQTANENDLRMTQCELSVAAEMVVACTEYAEEMLDEYREAYDSGDFKG